MGVNNPGSPLASNPTSVRDVEDGLNRQPGQINGLATLDAMGRVPTDQLPASIYYYQGMWNANTDTPALSGTTPTVGFAWSVSVAGTTTLGAISSWSVGDFAVYGALGWSKIPAGGVLTFAGRSGTVVPVAGDYDGLSLNLAAAGSFRVPSAASAAPTTASQVAYDSTAKHLKLGDGSSSLTVLDSSSLGVTVQGYSTVLADLVANGTPGDTGLAVLLAPDNNDALNTLGATAVGSDMFQAATQAVGRSTLGLGDLSVENSPLVATKGGTGQSTITAGDLLIGGTNALNKLSVGTNGYTLQAAAGLPAWVAPATARANSSAQGGTWRTTGSGTDTLLATDGTVEYSVSCTITLPAASACFVGQQITLIAATAGITLTLQRAGSDTLNGGTSTVAVVMATSRSVIGVVAQSSSAWGSLQPLGLSANGVKVYTSAGSFLAVAVNVNLQTGAITTLGAPVTMSTEGATYATVSGTTVQLHVDGAASTGAIESNSARAFVLLSALGLTFDASERMVTVEMIADGLSDNSDARVGTASLTCGLGTGATTDLTVSSGVYRTSSGTSYFGATVVANASAESLTSLGSANTRGSHTAFAVGTGSSCQVMTTNLNSAGVPALSSDVASGTVTDAAPTVVVVYARMTTTDSSDFYVSNPRWLIMFGPIIGGGGL